MKKRESLYPDSLAKRAKVKIGAREFKARDGTMRKDFYGPEKQAWDIMIDEGFAADFAGGSVLKNMLKLDRGTHEIEVARWYWGRLLFMSYERNFRARHVMSRIIMTVPQSDLIILRQNQEVRKAYRGTMPESEIVTLRQAEDKAGVRYRLVNKAGVFLIESYDPSDAKKFKWGHFLTPPPSRTEAEALAYWNDNRAIRGWVEVAIGNGRSTTIRERLDPVDAQKIKEKVNRVRERL